ncbi:phage portal protein [Oceanibacterium hippocampi]|uniref:Phage portal protein, lambda family n=1 Tax=Oceanibacterium hippocampi TaxID=745714 RepID=A0A1Y5TZM2_9PROT|nr:phage portal protein [Oceanibacterium hippocampi]SLN77583.1 Phage portal protein, lambda family [Oceanibacterium hippocampi]
MMPQPASPPALVDRHGEPLRRARPRASAPDGYPGGSFDRQLAGWSPWLGSADQDWLPVRDQAVARVRDLVRTDGWASGAVRRMVATAIGPKLRLQVRPDWRALGLDMDWAREWAAEVEARFRLWSEDPDHGCDAARQTDLAGLLALAYWHWMADGEALVLPLFDAAAGPNRYATMLQVIDPDRLSNPHEMMDSDRLRGGVEIDGNGAAVAYHFRKGHPGDFMLGAAAADRLTWERVPARTSWGRRRVIHYFERTRAGQTRGVSRFAPIVERLKMLTEYDRIELQASVVNAVFAAFIESPFDPNLMEAALGGDLGPYQTGRAGFHQAAGGLRLNGVRIPTLFPGEKFNFAAANRPAGNFPAFEAQVLRNIASGLGTSYEQLSQDWSRTNYSSARAALLESWKVMLHDRTRFAEGVTRQIFALWLEEAIERGDVELPAGAPDFRTGKAAWTRVVVIGPGRGWVDPTKEAQGSLMKMDAGLSTLEHEAAELTGADWEEILEQQAREQARRRELGLLEPTWAVIAEKRPESADEQEAEAEADARPAADDEEEARP